ncbi:MAG: EsaB/YukD family protein [Lachnospiraceae bacterium]|nr:EsaB/YukD family protein [Lachnospiraceae bacterium]
MDNKAIVIFRIQQKHIEEDLEIPLDITTNDLVVALNTAYNLGMDVSDVKRCYLKAERPVSLLRGNKKLADFGVRNGTIISFMY